MSFEYKNDEFYEKFRRIDFDPNISNFTKVDMLAIYPDGSIRIAPSSYKVHKNFIITDGEAVTIDLDGSVIPTRLKDAVDEMNFNFEKYKKEVMFGNQELFEKYYYGPDKDKRGESNEIPTIGKPVVIKSIMSFVLVLYDDPKSINAAIEDIVRAGGPAKYANSYLNNNFHNIGVGIQYINFSPFDLYYASHDGRRVEIIRKMSREDASRFIHKSRDYNLIDNFLDELDEGNYIILGIIENGKLNLHKFERQENCGTVGRSLQYADASRRLEIIPIFYTRRDAQVFLEDYDANTSNVYLDLASNIAEKRTARAVEGEVVESKKSMTAVAKVCAAMVSTGLAYGTGKAILDKVFDKQKSEVVVRNLQFANMIKNSSLINPKSVFATGALGVMSKFASAQTIGCAVASAAISPAVPIIAIGAGVVIIAVFAVALKDKIADFIEETPILKKVVDGVKAAGKKVVEVAKTVGSKIVEGAKFVGKKIVEGVKWVASGIASAISTVGEWVGNLFGW
ncbi:MAG: hypothetical protein ACRC5M_04970 [Anaeroplasmataceae bacterium]